MPIIVHHTTGETTDSYPYFDVVTVFKKDSDLIKTIDMLELDGFDLSFAGKVFPTLVPVCNSASCASLYGDIAKTVLAAMLNESYKGRF